MIKFMNGKPVAEKILKSVAEDLDKYGFILKLDVVLVGNDVGSKAYVREIDKLMKPYEINFEVHRFDNSVQSELADLVTELNQDEAVNGILIPLPLPKGINKKGLLELVRQEKDVDGINYVNGTGVRNNYPLNPPTAMAILKILEHYKILLQDRKVVIVGNGDTVGKPLSFMIGGVAREVVVCDSKTEDLIKRTREADVLVAAIGKPGCITECMIKEGCVVIDAGVNTINKNGRNCIVGDVDFNDVSYKTSYITPVPGGVGPVTTACLLENLVTACKIQQKQCVKL